MIDQTAPKEGNPKREDPGDPVPIDEPGEPEPAPSPPDEPHALNFSPASCSQTGNRESPRPR